MRTLHSIKLTILICIAVIPLGSCFVRNRIVKAPGRQSGPIQTASADDLVRRVRDMEDPIQSFRLRADMSPSVGSLYQGKIKDYATITGDIFYHEPDSIRIRGLDPVMHSTLFDMVSVGDMFRMDIPSKKQFIEGSNSAAPASSKSHLESMRPTAFLTSLIIKPPDTEIEMPLLEEDTTGGVQTYILLLIRRGPQEHLLRSLQFDRHGLQIIRQKTFDANGAVISDTAYSGWKNYGRIPFPDEIDIKRPRENYEVTLNVESLKLNPSDLTPDKFTLAQPPNTTLRRLE